MCNGTRKLFKLRPVGCRETAEDFFSLLLQNSFQIVVRVEVPLCVLHRRRGRSSLVHSHLLPVASGAWVGEASQRPATPSKTPELADSENSSIGQRERWMPPHSTV